MKQELLAGIGELRFAQEEGERPATLAAGSAAGEGGAMVLNLRFQGGLHLATAAPHLLSNILTNAALNVAWLIE